MSKPTHVTNRIRALRFGAGEMTQGELADRIGVTRQTVNAIEQGKYSPSLEVAFKIASVFGVPLEDVFQYSDQVGTKVPWSAEVEGGAAGRGEARHR